MTKLFFLGFAVISAGFFVGCGAPEAPPPSDPVEHELTEDDYAVPEEAE